MFYFVYIKPNGSQAERVGTPEEIECFKKYGYNIINITEINGMDEIARQQEMKRTAETLALI